MTVTISEAFAILAILISTLALGISLGVILSRK